MGLSYTTDANDGSAQKPCKHAHKPYAPSW